MRQIRLKLCTVFLLGIGLLPTLQGQEAIPATGGNASSSEGTVSFTIGQALFATKTGTNGSMAEGVQQPYEISVVVGIGQDRNINLICTVYPNPTIDLLTLEAEIPDNANLSIQLYNITGKLLISKKLIEIKTTISMAHLTPATYFLRVTNNHEVVKTFKIIKNQ